MGSSMRLLRSLAFSLGLLALVPLAFAQAVPATAPVPRVAFPITTAGNVVTFGMKTADAANAANFSFGVAANGSIFASAPDRLPTPGGGSIPVTVGGSIPKASVAAALGRFAKKTLPVLSAGVALYDLGQELGFGVDPSTNSFASVSTSQPCAVIQNSWGARSFSGDSCFSAAELMTADLKAAGKINGSMVSKCVVSGSPSVAPSCGAGWNDGTGSMSVGYDVAFTGPAVSTSTPVTASQFADAVSARDSWPPSSALARATLDAINSGESLDVQPSAVTGPATSPGPSSQSVNQTAGETTISTTTNHHTYNGGSVTTNVVTTNVTTNNSTGAVINSTTVNASPVVSSPAAEPAPFEMPCGVAGAPACAVKVDETTTPATVTVADPFPQIQQDHTEKLDAIKAADGAAWESVRDFFFLPPTTACVPFDMPVVMGIQVPDVNPCPVVSGIQQVTAVLWAIGAFWVMLGWVREVV